MKPLRTLLPLLLLVQAATAQVHVTPYGFVRTYLNIDSRQTYTVLNGDYNMLPYDYKWNSDSTVDLNAVPSLQLQALSSRIGLRLEGPAIWGMESSGKVEVDFGGFGTNNTVLRLREAYVALTREEEHRSTEYLVGQTWHPMSGEVMPDVVGMAAGAPFRPHSRTPQLRATTYRGSFGATVALLFQYQFVSQGPASATDASSAASSRFALQAMLPEAYLGIAFRNERWYTGLGLDALLLRPRTHAADPADPARLKAVAEYVGSLSPTLFVQFTDGPWSIKMRTLVAQNTSHLNQLVGYGVSQMNYIEGSWHYAPLRSLISFLNLSYGRATRLNLFLGYGKNLGSRRPLHDFSTDATTLPNGLEGYLIYMKGGDAFTHLNSYYRIAPSVSHTVGNLTLALEYELTAATFGTLAPNGSIQHDDALHQVAGHRLCSIVKYTF